LSLYKYSGWHSRFDWLLGRLATSTYISAQYFANKVDAVSLCHCQFVFANHNTNHIIIVAVYTVKEVSSLIDWFLDKSSAADQNPTVVLKYVADLVAPYNVPLFNTSITTVDSQMFQAFIHYADIH